LKRKRVIRIDGELYRRLVSATSKKNMTITAGAETGIKKFVEKIEYSYESLIEEITKQPLLRINKEEFSKMFKEIDLGTSKALIKILKEGIVNFYESKFENFDKILEGSK
jgi:hypothetical protein